MVVVSTILGLILVLLVFLIFTSIVLKIDTYNNQYYIQVWGIVKCSILWQEGVLIEFKTPFNKFKIDPFAPEKDKEKKELKHKKSDKDKEVSFKNFKKGYRVLKSFKIKKLKVDLDTSDMILNGYLYPVFFFLNTKKVHMNINYYGQVGLLVHVENRLARIIWALLR